MPKTIVLIFACIFVTVPSVAWAKRPPTYLQTLYLESWTVAKIVVTEVKKEKEFDYVTVYIKESLKGDLPKGSSTFKLLKTNIVDLPRLGLGNVGIAFFKKDQTQVELAEFLVAEDYIINTSNLLCASPFIYCKIKSGEELKSLMKKK